VEELVFVKCWMKLFSTSEWVLPREKVEEDDAKCPNISLVGSFAVVVVGRQEFWGHVRGGSASRLEVAVDAFSREAEVDDLRLVKVEQHDVHKLEVSVNDVVFVKVPDSFDDSAK
jgi:hypothetical protein